MKRISLTQNEINELADLYQTEIDRAQRRIANFKTILKKLSEGKSPDAQDEDVKPAKEPKRRGRKPKAQREQAVALADEPKKRGRKPKAEKAAEVDAKAEPKRRGRKPRAAKKAGVPQKRGRKPRVVRRSIKAGRGENKVKWIDLIHDILRSKQSLMLSNSLTLAAMERLEISDSDRGRARMAISANLTRLTRRDRTVVKYTQPGTSGSFYGLAEWFDENGALKPEFENKLM